MVLMSANKFVIILLAFGLFYIPSAVGLGGEDPFYDPFGQGLYGDDFGPGTYEDPFGQGPNGDDFGLETFGQDLYDPYQATGSEMAMSSGEDAAFYTTNRPTGAESLMDMGYSSNLLPSPATASSAYEPDADTILGQSSAGTQAGGQKRMLLESQGQVESVGYYSHYTSPNRLWIVDAYGNRRYGIDIPLYSWAREEIVPAVSGQLVIYERYPSGYVERHYPGYVHRGKKYQMWFYADSPGRHDVMYSVHASTGWYNSNSIWFNVYQSWWPGPYYPWRSSGMHWSYSSSSGGTDISISSKGTGTTMISSSEGIVSVSTGALER